MSDDKDKPKDDLDGLELKITKPDGTPSENPEETKKRLEQRLKENTEQGGYEYYITGLQGTSVVIRKEKPFTYQEATLLEKLKQDAIKKPEILKNPKKLAEITQKLFSNTGLRERDFIGYTKERGIDEAKWKKEGQDFTALVPTKDLELLDIKRKTENGGQGYLIPTPPKTAVSQAKNIDTLLYLLEKQNRKRDNAEQDRTGDLEFSLSDYAKIRGKSETELARGGKFIDELKRDLISGGITSYIIEKPKSYIIQNFYGLEIPKAKTQEKWRVFFNEPYKTMILEGKQYYPILLQAIQDKGTDNEKGYLYFFFKLVMSYHNTTTSFKTQLKVSTILDKIKVGERVKERPQEAFKILSECIYYTATHYEAIKKVRFFESGKCKKVKAITDLDKFKEWDYNTFKAEVLSELGLTDIRDACISFNTLIQDEPEATEQTGQDETTL